MNFDILTIFPEFFDSPLQEGIIRRALQAKQIDVNIINIRDFASDPHQMTDDRPFGGGEGMVMKPEPLADAVESCTRKGTNHKVIFLSPQGRRFTQSVAHELTGEDHLILVCGRYEGVDERFIADYVDEEISIGDFILTGGELGAMVLVDSITRLLPEVLGCRDSVANDTFSRNLLKHAQYTRPRTFKEKDVPPELLSGNHKQIEAFRFVSAVQRTLAKRPDLIAKEEFSKAEIKLLKQHGLLTKVEKVKKAGK